MLVLLTRVRVEAGQASREHARAEAAVDDDATEDEAETNYMELIEYLRFAALNVYMDSRSRAEDEDFSPDQVH